MGRTGSDSGRIWRLTCPHEGCNEGVADVDCSVVTCHGGHDSRLEFDRDDPRLIPINVEVYKRPPEMPTLTTFILIAAFVIAAVGSWCLYVVIVGAR